MLRGELSANAAAIRAGIRPKPSALTTARAAWRRLDAAERQAFLAELLGEATAPSATPAGDGPEDV